MADYKQVILVRTDLNLTKGKMSAQVAHAALEAYLRASKENGEAWRSHGAKKIVLKVLDEKELREYVKKAQAAKIPCALITDAGHTHLEPGTVTCLGIGPAPEVEIEKVTGSLKLMG